MTREEFWKRHDAQCKLEGPGTYDKAAHMALHREYYRQWAELVGPLPARLLDKCREALAAGDEHMNSPYTTLKQWDDMAYRTKGGTVEALRLANGEGWSLSFNICVLKEAARLQIEKAAQEAALRTNSFQRWAQDYARAFGFTVTLKGNWVELHKDGETVECMSVQGVQAACEAANGPQR